MNHGVFREGTRIAYAQQSQFRTLVRISAATGPAGSTTDHSFARHDISDLQGPDTLSGTDDFPGEFMPENYGWIQGP
jgi:hypothetical protein